MLYYSLQSANVNETIIRTESYREHIEILNGQRLARHEKRLHTAAASYQRSALTYSRRRTANIFGANFFRKGLLALREGLRMRPAACVRAAFER